MGLHNKNDSKTDQLSQKKTLNFYTKMMLKDPLFAHDIKRSTPLIDSFSLVLFRFREFFVCVCLHRCTLTNK